MSDQDETKVTELDGEVDGEKEALSIEEQAAKLKEQEPIADDIKAGEVDTAGDKKAEEKPPTAEEHAGVLAELKRVRKLNVEKEDKLNATNERVAKMEGRLEAGGGATTTVKQKLAQYNDRELVKLQMRWEDERDTARGSDDTTALNKAKENIESIRVELYERISTSASKESEEKADDEATMIEAAALIKAAVDAWPDLDNEDSEIFKAARKEFEDSPKVYRKLGVFADMVAVGAAVAKNPKLLGTGHDKAVRKDLTKELEKVAEKAVHAGGGSASVKTGSVNVEAMSGEDIEAAAERIKAGGSLAKP